MTILDGLKRLGSKSILFKQEAVKGGPKARGGITKIGQGGTLDPLADGVLGELELKEGKGRSCFFEAAHPFPSFPLSRF